MKDDDFMRNERRIRCWKWTTIGASVLLFIAIAIHVSN